MACVVLRVASQVARGGYGYGWEVGWDESRVMRRPRGECWGLCCATLRTRGGLSLVFLILSMFNTCRRGSTTTLQPIKDFYIRMS
eukprot:7262616-Prymnesium_polylepis.1